MSDTPEPAGGNAARDESSMPPAPGELFAADTMTPGAARRRFAAELRTLREAAGLTLAEAGDVIERSAATIHRFESNRYVPRAAEIQELLDHYRSKIPETVRDETRERILSLLAQGRKSEWYSSFKDRSTGKFIPGHAFRLAEYENDAVRIQNYESDLIPKLLQSYDYAQAVAGVLFPDQEPLENTRFAEFRLAQKARLEGKNGLRQSFVVNEIALRRNFGRPDVLRFQLLSLLPALQGEIAGIEIGVISMAAAVPAAMNGPFSILSFPEGSENQNLAYLESRSGATYLTETADVERYAQYFAALQAEVLATEDAVRLIESIIQELPSAATSWRTSYPTGARMWVSGDAAQGERLRDAMRELLIAYNVELIEAGPPQAGSWWQRFKLKTKYAFKRGELPEKIEEIEQGLRGKYIDNYAAQNDNLKADSVGKVLAVLAETDEAVVQLGQLIIVKHFHKTVVKSVDAVTAAKIERNGTLLSDPEAMIRLLSTVGIEQEHNKIGDFQISHRLDTPSNHPEIGPPAP